MAAPETCDLLVHGGTVYTVDAGDTVIRQGAIAIADGRIVAVGPESEILGRFEARETIDARGGAVHPGFIDAHVHVSQYTSRSVLPLMERRSATMADWKAQLRPEDEEASASLAAIDYLKAGYTGFVDPGTIFEPDAVAPVADRFGIRIWLTDPYVADLGPTLKTDLPELANDAFLARWPRDLDEALRRLGSQLHRNKGRSLVRAYIGLYGEGTESATLFRAAFTKAREAGVQFQEHLGYLPASYLARERQLGRGYLDALEGDGLLAEHVTFIHMNVVHEPDVRRLKTRGVRVVWCPYGQLQMIGRGGTEPRMVELARAGVPVGLATDIPRVVRFEALGTLAVAAAAASGVPVKASEVFRMLTAGAAATVGAEKEVGSLERGKRADLVIRSPDAGEAFGFDGPHEIALIGDPRSIECVIVDGVVRVRNGNLPGHDDGAIRARARESAAAIAGRIGLRG